MIFIIPLDYTKVSCHNLLCVCLFLHSNEDWDNIAEMLGTNRSGYQCFIVYQNKLNSSFRKSNWSPEEDKKLAKVIEMCRLGDYIPWGKVRFH